jgi:DNA polymerase-1
LKEELRRTEEGLAAEGYSVVRADGYEADDIIATLAAYCVVQGHEMTIVSDDKDFAQLVGNGVTLKTTRGAYDADAICQKFGVGPGKMIELQALTGDKADNVPGVSGIGPKTAAKLLQDHGTLEAVIDAACAGSIKTKNGKRAGACDAIMAADANGDLRTSRDLVTLRTDALTAEQCADALVMLEPKPLVKTAPTPPPEEDDEDMTDEDMGEIDAEPSAEFVHAPTAPAPEMTRCHRATASGWSQSR